MNKNIILLILTAVLFPSVRIYAQNNEKIQMLGVGDACVATIHIDSLIGCGKCYFPSPDKRKSCALYKIHVLENMILRDTINFNKITVLNISYILASTKYNLQLNQDYNVGFFVSPCSKYVILNGVYPKGSKIIFNNSSPFISNMSYGKKCGAIKRFLIKIKLVKIKSCKNFTEKDDVFCQIIMKR